MSDYPLTSPQEPLSWGQKQIGYDQGRTDDAGLTIDPASSFPWPDDPDARIWVPVYMSLNEYTALLSAVDVGASIAWTNDALLVYYILVRCFSGGSMQFCEKVIDCILNDPDVQQALADEMLADGPMRDAINQVSQKGAPLTTGQGGGSLIDGCDLDELFAGITSIVDTMNNNNEDFLEVMALAATQTKRLSTAISAIPIIGILPADEIVEWIGKLQAEVLTNYEAEWTTTIKDEYRCGLFCIARDHTDCALSYDDIFNYIQGRLGAALDPLNLVASLAQYTILGTWSGTTVVDILMLNQIAIWKAAGQWLGSVIRTLETVAALGKDSPDSDWLILCTDCPAPVIMVNTQTCLYVGQASGFNVSSGVDYTLTATGTFIYDSATGSSCGPDGIPPDPFPAGVEPGLKCLILMCKIGLAGSYFAVGLSHTFTAGSSGELYFSVNELYSASINTYADNSGVLSVTVT